MLIADSGGLTGAAGEVDAAAGALADIDVAGPFNDVSGALPGSETMQACLWVSTRLGAAVQVYADGLGKLADASRVTAQNFTGTDTGVATMFGPR
jgi:hypothetical protein